MWCIFDYCWTTRIPRPLTIKGLWKTIKQKQKNKMRKNAKIDFRCTSEQKTKIEARAELLGLATGTYLLMLGLHSQIQSPVLNIDSNIKKKYVKKKRKKIKTLK